MVCTLISVGWVILLLQASSGIRIGEMFSIRMQDINWEASPVELPMQDGMTKKSHQGYTYISTETSLVFEEMAHHQI